MGKQLLDAVRKRASPDKDIYEFGVYTGGHMKELAREIKGFGHMWGFDSFTGVPEESTDATGKRHWVVNRKWSTGGFSASDRLGEWNMTRLFAYLRKRINYPKITFVQGYYNVSLTPELRRQHPFRPALLADLDCDLHVSTVQAMRWLLQEKILVPGSLVRYDDWPRIHDPSGKPWGQRLAHIEVTKEFGVVWKLIVRSSSRSAPVYEIVQVGSSTPVTAIVDAERPSATWDGTMGRKSYKSGTTPARVSN